VSVPTRGRWRNQPCPPDAQWTPTACRVCRPRNSESALRMPPPGKRPDAATSAMPPGSRRPSVAASRPSCPPCRHVAAFKTKGAHPPPLTRPRAPFKWPAATRKTTSEALPEDRPSCRLRSGNPLRWIPGPSPKSTLRRRAPTPPPPPPQRIGGTIPTTGYDATKPQCQRERPLPLPRGSPQGMLPHGTPRCFNCISVAYVDRDALRTRALTMKARRQRGAGHSRTCCPRANITASHEHGCPCTFCWWQPCSWTARHRTNRPPEEPPAYRPPKGKRAVEIRTLSS